MSLVEQEVVEGTGEEVGMMVELEEGVGERDETMEELEEAGVDETMVVEEVAGDGETPDVGKGMEEEMGVEEGEVEGIAGVEIEEGEEASRRVSEGRAGVREEDEGGEEGTEEACEIRFRSHL